MASRDHTGRYATSTVQFGTIRADTGRFRYHSRIARKVPRIVLRDEYGTILDCVRVPLYKLRNAEFLTLRGSEFHNIGPP